MREAQGGRAGGARGRAQRGGRGACAPAVRDCRPHVSEGRAAPQGSRSLAGWAAGFVAIAGERCAAPAATRASSRRSLPSILPPLNVNSFFFSIEKKYISPRRSTHGQALPPQGGTLNWQPQGPKAQQQERAPRQSPRLSPGLPEPGGLPGTPKSPGRTPLGGVTIRQARRGDVAISGEEINIQRNTEQKKNQGVIIVKQNVAWGFETTNIR